MTAPIRIAVTGAGGQIGYALIFRIASGGLFVANPCNTNCLIAKSHAPNVPADRWYAMTRLDQNRASAQLATKAGVPVGQVTCMTIWGNHSDTQYPDYKNARIGGTPATKVITD